MARILYAEDDRNIYMLVSVRLQRRGHKLIWAQNGSAALALVHQQMPDLILLDVRLPLLDGITVLKHLKADPITAATPVILLTASAQERERTIGLESGATAYIIKPFDFPMLIAAVDAVLAHSN